MNNPNQPTLCQLLYELDELYHTAPLAAYETALQAAAMQVQQALPDLTIAAAEISTAGSQREAHGGIRHVLLPLPARSSSPGPDVQSSTEQYRAVQSIPDIHPCTMVTLPDAWPTAQRHGPLKRIVLARKVL
ncbi:MAG TPA: hypothetical protein VHZ51_19590 [Ktedonobacteraceae bacterium]|nr:hypothetical protein [Ktedonobacteraceae bacterium]